MASSGVLPTYQRRGRPGLRPRERIVLLLAAATFAIICLGTFLFLPRTGLLLPPLHRVDKNVFQPHDINSVDPHLILDRAKLALKIQEDLERAQLDQPPQIVGSSSSSSSTSVSLHEARVGGGDPQDPETRAKRDKIREMMKHAWDNYARYAWGANELRPVSRRGHSAGIFGKSNLGATIVDALSTLLLMGLKEEFTRGRDWVAQHLNLDDAPNSEISVFETNIRFIGGLLSCYAMTGDVMFREKADHVAQKLLPAFDTPTGIPNALVHLKSGASKNYAWASSSSSILAEFGTLHLEFTYLSDVTGNPVYKEKVDHIRQTLAKMERPHGLFPNYLNPKTGSWGQHHISMGALGDSFYEYLLKAWIQSNGQDTQALSMFRELSEAINDKLVQTSKSGLRYLADLKYDRIEHKMDHLACFAGGFFAMGSEHMLEERKDYYMQLAKDLTHTCHESYDRTVVKLGPESFRFTEGSEAKALKQNEKYYLQRPEVIESYFVLWRFTKDPKYRQWGWEAAQAIEQNCRVESGYSGLRNVYLPDGGAKDDVQQSFFLAETLKYLYLLFSEDELLPFDQWVLNTEAHPLPIKGRNPVYS